MQQRNVDKEETIGTVVMAQAGKLFRVQTGHGFIDLLHVQLQVTKWEISPNWAADPAQHKQLKVKTRVLNKRWLLSKKLLIVLGFIPEMLRKVGQFTSLLCASISSLKDPT